MATPIPQNSAAFTLDDIARHCSGQIIQRGTGDETFSGVCTDSRLPQLGKVFIPLSGEHFDGHKFVVKAIESGAACIVAERDIAERLPAATALVVVDSCLLALGRLAAAHRKRWRGKLIAVAGSAGKTTTRIVISQLLDALTPGAVHSTPGNLNNQIGVPMVLLGLESVHKVAVVEVGTNAPGEVSALTAMSAPDVGVLTLIELEHTEGLGDISGVEKEEASLFTASDCVAIGNGDDARVRRILTDVSARSGEAGVLYGTQAGCQYWLKTLSFRADGQVDIECEAPNGALNWTSPFAGRPGALACAAALAVAEQLGHGPVSNDVLARAFVAASDNGRLGLKELSDDILLIDDSYNANPASVEASLETAQELAKCRGGRLHLVLGEMRELGVFAESEHARVGRIVRGIAYASLIAIGREARAFLSNSEAPEFFVDSAEQALPLLLAQVGQGDIILVKASRGIGAERVAAGLIEERGLRQ